MQTGSVSNQEAVQLEPKTVVNFNLPPETETAVFRGSCTAEMQNPAFGDSACEVKMVEESYFPVG